jgi:hypothetical protein
VILRQAKGFLFPSWLHCIRTVIVVVILLQQARSRLMLRCLSPGGVAAPALIYLNSCSAGFLLVPGNDSGSAGLQPGEEKCPSSRVVGLVFECTLVTRICGMWTEGRGDLHDVSSCVTARELHTRGQRPKGRLSRAIERALHLPAATKQLNGRPLHDGTICDQKTSRVGLVDIRNSVTFLATD